MRTLFLILIASTAMTSPLSWAETYTGRVDFKDIVPIGTTVSGTVTSVRVRQGERVAKGAILITLDDTLYQAKKAMQQATLKQALITDQRAKRDYQHAQELYQRAALSSVELEDARLKQEHTAARVAEISAELATTEHELAQCRLVAPFDGWIINVNVSAHETVVNNLKSKTLLTLARADHYIVHTSVSLARLKTLPAQPAISVNIDGSTYTGRIAGRSLMAQRIDNREQAYYDVIIEFSSDKQLIVSGEPAKIEF